MSYTISAHFGTKMSCDHNIRNPKVVDSEKHIDPKGYHETIQDSTVRQAYYQLFGQAQLEYNAKQTRSDRLINDYFSKVLEAYKRDPKRNPATSQEAIFTIGNVNDHPDVKKSEEILLDFLEKWKADNPNVHVFGVYFHADEPGSAPHLHVDYILIKRENKRGMSLQVGQEGALKEMGYFTTGTTKEGNRVTAQTKWQQSTREMLRNVAREHGLDVQEPGPGQGGVKHLDTKIYKKQTELKKLEQEISQAKQDLNNARQVERNTRQKAQRNEQRAENAIKEMKEAELTKEQTDELKFENERLFESNQRLRKENGVLKKALKAVNKAFDLVEDYMKSKMVRNSENEKVGLWTFVKGILYDTLGKEAYDNYTSARHYDDKPLKKRAGFDLDR